MSMSPLTPFLVEPFAKALEGFPLPFVTKKLEMARDFAQSLRGQTSFNHLSQAARAVLLDDVVRLCVTVNVRSAWQWKIYIYIYISTTAAEYAR